MENTFLTAFKLYYHYNCQLTLYLISIFMIHFKSPRSLSPAQRDNYFMLYNKINKLSVLT